MFRRVGHHHDNLHEGDGAWGEKLDSAKKRRGSKRLTVSGHIDSHLLVHDVTQRVVEVLVENVGCVSQDLAPQLGTLAAVM